MADLKEFFDEVSRKVNAELDWLIPETGPAPKSLRDAIRWSLFGGGKAFRPALVFAVGRMFGASDEQLVRTAAAIEMMHTYSLIHDDLPSMDDDDLRRGRATCHIQFGEATAILAGDALQVLAFQAISEDDGLPPETKLDLINGLSRAAAKMVAGQQLDLEAEGRNLSLEQVEEIHRNKTGALIEFSVKAGAIIGNASQSAIEEAVEYGANLGLLFQVTDDVLDVTQPTEELGKTAGKDLVKEKATYPSILGVEVAAVMIREIEESVEKLVDRSFRGDYLLKGIAKFLSERTN